MDVSVENTGMLELGLMEPVSVCSVCSQTLGRAEFLLTRLLRWLGKE